MREARWEAGQSKEPIQGLMGTWTVSAEWRGNTDGQTDGMKMTTELQQLC